MNRDYAEKQDLWAEMNELWINRKRRQRKVRLSIAALFSVVIMVGAYAYNIAPVTPSSLYLQVQGQSLEVESTINNCSAACIDPLDNTIEIAQTLSI